jgi:CRISPR system Cascade subunit CasE
MFLSKLILNPRSREARRDLANPYELHRTLARAFAPDAETSPPRFLWRLESSNAWQQPVLLVQSACPGNWASLAALPNYLHGEVQEKALEPERWLEPGRPLRFRLQANPTVTREGKRWGLYGEEEQLAWLARQGDRHGFVPVQALVSASAMQQGRKGQSRLSVLTATFDGYLQVRDATTLVAALRDGIGPAKSLGCGLLTLGRA